MSKVFCEFVSALLIFMFLLVFVSLIAQPFIDAEVKSRPAINFYTEQAYNDCAAMGKEALAKGYTRWICHPPKSAP